MSDGQHLLESPFSNLQWIEVDLKPSLLSEALKVFAWVFMLGFFAGIILTLADRQGDYGALVALSGVAWMACAISLIRIRRGLKKRLEIRRRW